MRTFEYPSEDVKLRQVEDWVFDLEAAYKHIKTFGVCIQAGGAVGVWPSALAEKFDTVYTFEPVLENYNCLVKNVPSNVIYENCALGYKSGTISMSRDDFEDRNSGAWYAIPGGDVAVKTIDSLNLDRCDFICLDVEGFEKDVILGAINTIEEFKPVIMLEEKQLPHMRENCSVARVILEDMGYDVVDSVHRDIILTC